MPILRERIVKEDLEIGSGTVNRTRDDGSTQVGTKVNVQAFYPIVGLTVTSDTSQSLVVINPTTEQIVVGNYVEATSGNKMHVVYRTTDASADVAHTALVGESILSSGSGAATHVGAGVQGFFSLNAAGTYSGGYVGTQGVAYSLLQAANAAINVNQIDGIVGRVTLYAAGTVTTPSALRADGVNVSGTAVCTDANGLIINNHSVAGGGSITTAGGIKIAAITAGTTNYAIRALGGQSYHVGSFTVGAAQNPASPLDVYGADNAAIVHFRRTGGNVIAKINADSDGDGTLTLNNLSASAKVVLNSNGASYLIGGDVGIGTSSPSVPFHVKVASAEAARIENSASGSFILSCYTTDGLSGSLKANVTSGFRLSNNAGIEAGVLGGSEKVFFFFSSAVGAGGGDGVILIPNRTTAPTTNPSGGGILYAASGALVWRGSSGTITTIAPA